MAGGRVIFPLDILRSAGARQCFGVVVITDICCDLGGNVSREEHPNGLMATDPVRSDKTE